MKSEAACRLIGRIAPVLIDSNAVSKLFNIVLSAENVDHQACVVELLVVCYLLHECLMPVDELPITTNCPLERISRISLG